MDEFKVKIGQVRNAVSESKQMAAELSGIQNDLYGVRSRLSFQISHRARIDRRLQDQGLAVGTEKKKMDRVASALSDIADRYERTEKELCGEDSADSMWDKFKPIVESVIPGIFNIFPTPFIPFLLWTRIPPLAGSGVWPVVNWTFPFPDKVFPTGDKILNIGKDIASNKVQSVVDKAIKDADIFGDKAKDFFKAHTKDLYASKKVYDRATNTWKDVDLTDDDAVKKFNEELKRGKLNADVKLASVSGGVSAALWSAEAGISGKYGHASVKASAGQAEVHGEGYIGLYQKDPTTGKLEFKPGIGGSVGASVTGFTAEEEAMLGGDMLGVYAKSTQTVGRAAAKAEGSVGLYDKDGKFTPSAYGSVSAEVIGGEITGAVGAKVLGADVGVSGSLNYGLGAHANVGFHDGKVSLDVGATLGVGASVKLEVDIGGTVDAVCNTAKSAWNNMKKWKLW